MTITSIGYAGSIGWAAWAQMARDLGTDYGIDGVDDLKVTIKAAAAGEITVTAGTAHGQGIIDTSDATLTLAGLIATNVWYTIVVRRDWTGGPGAEVTTILALAGSAAQAIAASRQVGAGVIDDQPIALVHRGSTLDQVIDLRCWWGNGGLLAASTDALAYLGRPGSQVRVGASVYTRTLGTQWTELTDAVAAARVTSGVLDAARIPQIDASKISTGVLAAARIPALPASRITEGVLAAARIPTIDQSKVAGTWNKGVATGDRVACSQLIANDEAATSLVRGSLTVGKATTLAGRVYLTSGDVQGNMTLSGQLRTQRLFSEDTINSPGSYGTTVSGAANLYITSAGNIVRTTSSRRYKRDIVDADPMPSVLDIRPRTWTDRNDPSRSPRFGAIAEELHDLGLTRLVEYDEEGRPDAIAYSHIAIALIPHVRALADRVEAQADQIAALTAAVESLGGVLPSTVQED